MPKSDVAETTQLSRFGSLAKSAQQQSRTSRVCHPGYWGFVTFGGQAMATRAKTEQSFLNSCKKGSLRGFPSNPGKGVLTLWKLYSFTVSYGNEPPWWGYWGFAPRIPHVILGLIGPLPVGWCKVSCGATDLVVIDHQAVCRHDKTKHPHQLFRDEMTGSKSLLPVLLP